MVLPLRSASARRRRITLPIANRRNCGSASSAPPARRHRVSGSRGVLVLIAVGVLCLAEPQKVIAQGRQPNFTSPNLLIVVADDHAGGTLGIEGDPRHATPNLDKLAEQGVLFERAFCNSPLCTPSRQSLITGRLPHAIGVTQLTTALSDDVLTAGEWLHDLDYQTVAIGKMHFNGPSRHGFSLRSDSPAWETELFAHPPYGGDKRRPWRPGQDPAADLAERRLPVLRFAGSVDALHFLCGPRDPVSQAAARPPVRDGHQLLRAAQSV